MAVDGHGLGCVLDGDGVLAQSERQWLDRFVARRDEAAFAALVRRHGPMVAGVCQSYLPSPADADDAFQATFLVLARRAGTLRDGDRLGPWLHGVARRVSLRARAVASRRRGRESSRPDLVARAPGRPGPTAEAVELAALLHAEVDQLAAPERAVVVLCDLEGCSHQEAADQLGWPLGTVKSRVARARDRLRARLARRGVALAAPALAATLAAEAGATAPAPSLVLATARAAAALVAGRIPPLALVSPSVASLTHGVARAMILSKMKALALGLAASTAALAVPGVYAFQFGGMGPPRQGVEAVRGRLVPADRAEKVAPDAPVAKAASRSADDRAEPETGQARANAATRARLDGPNILKQAALNALDPQFGMMGGGMGGMGMVVNIGPTFRVLTQRLAELRVGGTVESALGGRCLFDIAARELADSKALDVKAILDADDSLNLGQALDQAARSAGLKYRIIDGDLFFEAIDPAAAVAAANAAQAKAAAPATVAAPGRPTPDGEALNRAILARLEGPNPLRSKLDQFDGSSGPGPKAGPPPVAALMQILTEATVDPNAGLPVGIPVRLTAAAKQVPPPLGVTVASLVAGDESTPLRVALTNYAADLGLGYRVAGGALILDAAPTARPGAAVPADTAERKADDERRNALIRAKLDRPAALTFPGKVSIDTVLTRVVQVAKEGPDDRPIPVYLDPTCFAADPNGNKPAVADSKQPVITIDLVDVPLRTSLRLALRQVDLDYTVAGGLLIIGRPFEIDRLLTPGQVGGGMGGMGGMMGGAGGGGFR